MSSPVEPAATVRAAGGVLWRPAASGAEGAAGIETAVVHRPRYDDWSLPKGKPEDGEHALETAVREVAEETGLAVVVGRRGLRTRYPVAAGTAGAASKVVDYWLMQCVGGQFAANYEVDDLRWLPPQEAVQLCSYEHDRAVLADLARTDVPRAPTLLLVRHGRAGDKTEWDGPDDLRPLDAKGQRQAERLAEVLPHFGPTSVLSARRTRCEQTVAPLAERLGLPVLPLEPLGEEEFQRDPEAGLAAVEQLLAERSTPGVTVVCSQGGAIPSVLMALGVRWQAHGPAAGRLWPPAAKGSVWALGGPTGDVTADYYRDFQPTW